MTLKKTPASPSDKPNTTATHVPSLFDIQAAIQVDPGLSPARRREIASGFNTVAKVLKTDLRQLPADIEVLRERLFKALPMAVGITQQRWRNATSLLRSGLARSEISAIPARQDNELMQEWRNLLLQEDAKPVRKPLSRLARCCSRAAIPPLEVSQAVLEHFTKALEKGCLIRSPHEVKQGTAAAWNTAVDTVPGWPQTRLEVPKRLKNPSLPLSAFPESFGADVDGFLQARSKPDLFALGNTPVLRKVTLDGKRIMIRQMATAAVEKGTRPEEIRSLADLVQVDRAREILEVFVARAGGKSTSRCRSLAFLLQSIAKHHVHARHADLKTLNEYCLSLKVKATGMTRKNRERLRQLDDPIMQGRVLGLPGLMLDEAAKVTPPTLAEARLAQTALAIAICIKCALRAKNLAQLKIGETLLIEPNGRSYIVFAADEVKNEQDIEIELSKSTDRMLRTYLNLYHPLLAPEGSPWLFPSHTGSHKAITVMSKQVAKCLAVRCGLEWNAHAFRHMVGKLYLEEHPGAYGVVMLLLGHKSIETTIRYYCGTETKAAFAKWDAFVEGHSRTLVRRRTGDGSARISR